MQGPPQFLLNELNNHLKIEQSKVDPIREKLISKVKVFYGGYSEEIKQKVKQCEEQNPESFIEQNGDLEEGQQYEQKQGLLDEQKYICKRCDQIIFKKDYFSHRDSHSSQILDWLYLGGANNAGNLKELTIRTQIKYILNVAVELQNEFPEQFIYKKCPIEDNLQQDISPFIDECLEFISQAKNNQQNILVHCIQGMSRSATIVIAYLMKSLQMDLKTALIFVKSKRNIVRPNQRFLQFLQQYEYTLYQKNSASFEELIEISQIKQSEQLLKENDQLI